MSHYNYGCFYGMIIGNLLGSSYNNLGKKGLENKMNRNICNSILTINLDDFVNNVELPLLLTITYYAH